MSRFSACPTCRHAARGGLLGGVYIELHKCKPKGHWFCNQCKNGDRCPLCGTDEVYWEREKAFKG